MPSEKEESDKRRTDDAAPFKNLTTSHLFLFSLLFRILNAYFLRNAFTPDEHWQGSEVAHRLVFGYGHLTWEWEPCVALRSIIHPGLIAVFYYFLALCGIDTPYLVAYGPRLLFGSVTGALTDVGAARLARVWHGVGEEKWKAVAGVRGSTMERFTLLLSWGSWFLYYTICRTYSSCLEAALTVWGVYFWAVSRSQHASAPLPKQFLYSLIVASSCIALRPTSCVTWAILYASGEVAQMLLSHAGTFAHRARSSVLRGLVAIPVLLSQPALALLADRAFYGRWTLPMINFAAFNFFADPGLFYGSRPWHFYIGESLGVIYLSYLPLLALGLYTSCQAIYHSKRRETRAAERDLGILLLTVALNVILLSKTTHKEYRLFLPFVPLLMPVVCQGLLRWAVMGLKEGDEEWPELTAAGHASSLYLRVVAFQLAALVICLCAYLTVSVYMLLLQVNHLYHAGW